MPRKNRAKYRSKFEGHVAKKLPKKIKPEYEPETLKYTLELEYNPDWSCTINGKKVFIEAKGKFNYIERRKVLGVIKTNPGIDLRLVFMRDNKINSKSGTRYTGWCAKHSIKCSVFPKLPFSDEELK
jgi:hypothetical protein